MRASHILPSLAFIPILAAATRLGAGSGPPAATAIPVQEGDSVTVRVASVSTARCEAVSVSGGLSGVLFPRVGRCGGVSTGPGQTVTRGPVGADGVLSIFLSSAPNGGLARVSGTGPDYTVAMDDGMFDSDYNDVVLTVTIHGGKPRLACTPSRVERGQEVTCKVTGRATVNRWDFQTPVLTVASSSTEREWKGIAVKGGKVRAFITVDGEDDELEASFTVTPRNWHWNEDEHWSFHPGAALRFTEREPSLQFGDDTLGWNCFVRVCDVRRVQPDLLTASPEGAFEVEEVAAGPNQGLWYVKGVHFRMDRASGMNRGILPEAQLRTLPEGDQARECRTRQGMSPTVPVQVNFYLFNTNCKQVNLQPLLSGVWAHEGFGTRGNNGHESAARLEALQPRNDPFRAAEDKVRDSEAGLLDGLARMAKPMQMRINAAGASHIRTSGNYNLRVWVWDGGANRYVEVIYHDPPHN